MVRKIPPAVLLALIMVWEMVPEVAADPPLAHYVSQGVYGAALWLLLASVRPDITWRWVCSVGAGGQAMVAGCGAAYVPAAGSTQLCSSGSGLPVGLIWLAVIAVCGTVIAHQLDARRGGL